MLDTQNGGKNLVDHHSTYESQPNEESGGHSNLRIYVCNFLYDGHSSKYYKI